MQNKNYSEIAYLLRANGANIDNIIEIDIEKKYVIKCNGVKKTSNAKKTTAHKLEAQINKISDAIDRSNFQRNERREKRKNKN